MEQKDYRLAAILYTDIVGFSKMMGENEAETLRILDIHNKIIEKAVSLFHGKVIKTIGDAYMVDFRNTVEALQCAIEIQERLYEYNQSSEGYKLLIRIGLHLGDIYFYEKDAFGEGINIAARLQSFAKPGCICFSQDVFNQVLNKIDFHAEKLGRVSLKNIAKEIHAYEIETKNTEFDKEKTSRNRKILLDPIEVEEKNEELKNTAKMHSESIAQNESIREQKSETVTSESDAASQSDYAQIYGNSGFAEKTETRNRGSSCCDAEHEAGVEDAVDELGHAIETIASAAGKKINDFFEKLEGDKSKSEKTYSSYSGYSGRFSKRKEQKEQKVSPDVKIVTTDFSQAKSQHDWDSFHKDYAELRKQKASPGDWDFEKMAKKSKSSYSKAVTGFIAHLLTFMFVNALLWFLNIAAYTNRDAILSHMEKDAIEFNISSDQKMMKLNAVITNDNFFPWAGIITFAWGIGIIANFFDLVLAKRKMKELLKINPLSESEYSLYLRITRHRSEMVQHSCSAFSVSFLLFYINAITTMAFPWFVIPAAVLIFSWLIHAVFYYPKKQQLVNDLCEMKKCDRWSELFL